MTKVLYSSTKNKDVRYILGPVVIPDSFFLIEKDGTLTMFVDHREFELLKEKIGNKAKVILLNPLLDRAQKINSKQTITQKLAVLIFEELGLFEEVVEVSNSFPLDLADAVREAGAKLSVVENIFPKRSVKAQEEIECIRRALKNTSIAFLRIEEILENSKIVEDTIVYKDKILTSEYIKSEIDRVLFNLGMYNLESSIVSCGKDASVPHHPGEGILKPNQTIICDIFPEDRISGYCADMTRTYVKGKPSEYVIKMYEAVLEAQRVGIENVKQGVVGKDLHTKVSQEFILRGFEVGDKGFIHGTGHGLGLDIHETPYLNARSEEILEVGNVVTVEPGLYYKEHGGVRIEDVVLVTKSGPEVLSSHPNRFVIP